MRNYIWKIATSKHPEGMILPWYLLAVRAILYPLDFFYWRMSRTTGYDPMCDVWKIEGVSYTGAAMRALAESDGEIYKFKRTGDTLTVERVEA
jgi:hypothetical protein